MSFVWFGEAKFKTSRMFPCGTFWCGCSCCSCSCCDRGKTKSTPSPKTAVWTLDWSLTTDTKSHQLFSKIHHAQIKCLTLVPKIKIQGNISQPTTACTIFLKDLFLLPSSVKSSLSQTEWLYYHLIKFDSSPSSTRNSCQMMSYEA